MISFAIDSIGAADGCGGVGLVGEGGRTVRSCVSGRWPVDEHVARGNGTRAIDDAPNSLFGNTGRWWWGICEVTVGEGGELVTLLCTGE